MSTTTPGKICVSRNAARPVSRPGNLKRENAHAAVAARKRPMIVVAPATQSELKNWWPKSQWPAASVVEVNVRKFSNVTADGIGFGFESNDCAGETAIFKTQSTG